MFQRFNDSGKFLAFYQDMYASFKAIDGWLAEQNKLTIYCPAREGACEVQQIGGGWLGQNPHLREGLLCECGLNNRSRLMLSFVKLAAKRDPKDAKVAVFETGTPLVAALEASGFQVFPSAYHPESDRRDHQDMTATTYDSEQFDIVIHNDVLEHIPEYEVALRDNFRILKSGGTLIFTAPIFAMEKTVVRATVNAGEIIHHLEPEYHGDPLNPQGILAFYNFGADLLNQMKGVGFREPEFWIDCDPLKGFSTNNHPVRTRRDGSEFGNMLPCGMVAQKK